MSQELLATSTKELPVLRKGDSGAAVKLLQNILMIGNFFSRDLPTGKFLDQTELAVKNFQRQYNLQADGIVGAKTWDQLGNLLADLTYSG